MWSVSQRMWCMRFGQVQHRYRLNPADAEDVTQNGYVIVAKHDGRHDRHQVFNWQAINHLRRESRKDSALAQLIAGYEPPRSTDPCYQAMTRDLWEWAERQLGHEEMELLRVYLMFGQPRDRRMPSLQGPRGSVKEECRRRGWSYYSIMNRCRRLIAKLQKLASRAETAHCRAKVAQP